MVFSGDSADIVETTDTAAEAAVFDEAPIGACDTADPKAPVSGGNAALNVQIVDYRVKRDIAEQRLVGTVGGERKAADPMAVAVKRSGEGGDWADILSAEIQICLQFHRDAF